MRTNKSEWTIIHNGVEGLVIRDDGTDCISVTNDAENVVARLASLLGPRRLFYFDSLGDFDELLVKDGVFAGFAPFDPVASHDVADLLRREGKLA
jgi:hypothetical protein